MRSEGAKNRRMLIIRFSALGDVAMTIPVVYSLARQYPDLHIDFVTTPFFARLFINAPANVSVHGFDIKKEYKGVAGTLRLLRKLSALKPDIVADLHNVLRSWIIGNWFRMKGVKVVMVDKMRKARRAVIKDKISQPSFFSRYAEVLSKSGYPVNLDFISIFQEAAPPTPADVRHPAVGIAPFARYSNKSYPLGMMREVVSKLAGNGVNVYLFGGRGSEADKLAEIAGTMTGCTSLAGKFQIEEELALMSQMDVMVSMDSANHHLASLSATPVVSIWGSTTPACGFMGYGQKTENAVCLNLGCQPCTIAGSETCARSTFACMRDISPSEITSRILANLPDPVR